LYLILSSSLGLLLVVIIIILTIVVLLCGRATGVLDDMPIFFEQSAANLEGNLLAPGEDTASHNVLIEKMFGGRKLVFLLVSRYAMQGAPTKNNPLY